MNYELCDHDPNATMTLMRAACVLGHTKRLFLVFSVGLFGSCVSGRCIYQLSYVTPVPYHGKCQLFLPEYCVLSQ